MDRFFYSMLPMVWLVAAAAVALLLYKSSRALVKADKIGGLPVKEVRLTGSIAIFVVVYVLLWQTTENMLVHDRDSNMLGISRSDARDAREAVGRIERAAIALDGCAQIPGMPLAACPDVDPAALNRDVGHLANLLPLASAPNAGEENSSFSTD